MKKKVPVKIEDSHRIINAGPLVLISASLGDAATVTPIAWAMPASGSPKLMAVAFAHKRYSLELLVKAKCFCINVPDVTLEDRVMFCGKNSGRDTDKFAETGLTPLPCDKICSIYVDECIAHIECAVYDTFPAGDHTIVLGEAVNAFADEGFINEHGVVNLDRYSPLHHLGGKYFTSLKPV